MNAQYCKNCKFFQESSYKSITGIAEGTCRRFPPGIIAVSKTEGMFGFVDTKNYTKYVQPRVNEYGWCGEFKTSDNNEKH